MVYDTAAMMDEQMVEKMDKKLVAN